MSDRPDRNHDADAERLICGWLDGELDSAEEQALNTWLRESPDHMKQLVAASIHDQQLREAIQMIECGASAADHITVPAMDEPIQPRKPWIWKTAVSLAAAASITLAFLFTWDSNEEERGVRAKVVTVHDARSNTGGEILEVGSQLVLEAFSLESGSLELSLESGVLVELLAPVQVTFENAMRMRLFRGRVNADVGERGKGFTIETDAGEIIDLGTRFGVEADPDGESRVAVFTGMVKVRPREGQDGLSRDTITLMEGQAARFSVLAGLRRWEQVALAAQAAGIASMDYAGVVSRVRDNLGDDSLHPFYGVVSGGMRPGALAYTDKPNPRWTVVPGQPFPEMLDGADLVRTYHQFRNNRRYRMNLTLSEPAHIFVLQDSREEGPEWLEEQFEKTGQQLRIGPWNPAVAHQPGAEVEVDGPYLTADVWVREVPAGDFELGPPRSDEADVPVVMYGIAIRAQKSDD